MSFQVEVYPPRRVEPTCRITVDLSFDIELAKCDTAITGGYTAMTDLRDLITLALNEAEAKLAVIA